MIVALDENRSRVWPSPGGRATCQVCEETLIAYCGKINQWHWQHKQDRDCDPWKEHETEWHRAWKNKFNKDWQEIIISSPSGEKHIADIKTPNGLVVEFQNSSISASTIEVRERFYDKMIWVINAKEFKGNFRMTSVVKDRLMKVKDDIRHNVNHFEIELTKEIKADRDELYMLESERAIKSRDKKESIEDLGHFESAQNDLVQFADKVFLQWTTREYHVNSVLINELTQRVNKAEKELLISVKNEIEQLKVLLDEQTKIRARVDAIPTFQYDGKLFKIVSPETINKTNFHRALLLKKESLSSLFIVAQPIRHEFELSTLQARSKEYLIVIDPSDAYNTIDSSVKKLTNELAGKENEWEEIKNRIRTVLPEIIHSKIQLLKEHIQNLTEKIEHLDYQYLHLKNRVEEKERSKSEEINKTHRMYSEESKSKQVEIMNKHKGRYLYEWKHERPSWRAATKTIFFDMGDGSLFKKIGEEDFQKYTIDEFVKGVQQALV